MSWIRFQCVVAAIFISALAGLSPCAPAWAAPYISEIVLPAAGTTAVEVAGLDASGATLLIVNASRTTFSVQQVVTLPAATAGNPASSLAIIAETDGIAAAAGQATTITRSSPLFLPDRPTALVLIHGHSTIDPSARLGTDSPVPGISPMTPIVDWVSFTSGTLSPLQEPTAATIAALGISHLDRPTAITTGFTALARAITAQGPVMDSLLAGTANGFIGDAANIQPFAYSPGRENPLTAFFNDNDDPHAPEPGVGLLFALGGLGAARRPTRR